MIISHQHRFIFFRAPKSASTSVQLALSSLCGQDDIVSGLPSHHAKWDEDCAELPSRNLPSSLGKHAPPLKVKRNIDAEVWNSYLKVCVTRNPWDLYVSTFFWNNRGTDIASKGVDCCRQKFQQWCFKKPDRGNQNFYFLPNGAPACEVYLRYESLEADLQQFCEIIDVPAPKLPQTKNKCRPNQLDFRDLYCLRTRLAVARLNAQTISHFGYEFEPASEQ